MKNGNRKMEKGCILVFWVLLAVILTSCHQAETEISELSAVQNSIPSVQNSQVIAEISENSSPELSQQATSSMTENTKRFIEQFVSVDQLGEKTKSTLTSVFDSKELYADITGESELFGAVRVSFQAEFAKSDESLMKKLSLGGTSVTTIQNSQGTYLLDDDSKTALLTDSDSESDLKNNLAGKIFSYVSANFGLTDSLQYVKNGSEIYQGKTYDFEEYCAGDKTLKAYFDGNQPTYLTSTDKNQQTSVITIHTLSFSADKTLFQIPDHYKIISQ